MPEPVTSHNDGTLQKLNLPLVDFKNYHRSAEDAQKVGNALFEACRDVGFAYLINIGIPQEDVDQMFKWSKNFFSLPHEIKRKAPHPSEGAYHRGFSGVGVEQVSQKEYDLEKLAEIRKQAKDHKESFEIGNEDDDVYKNIWVPEEDCPGFREYSVRFWNQCRKFQDDLLGALSLGLPEVPEGFLNEYHLESRNQLRLLHYPAATHETFGDNAKGRISAHTDHGTCTFLFQDECGGLEVEDPKEPGVFLPAPPIPGAVVFNIGDFMNRWSNDSLKSTLHRVRAPPPKEGTSITPARYSIPYFVVADRDKVIDALPGTFSKENPKKFSAITVGEYIAMRLNATYF